MPNPIDDASTDAVTSASHGVSRRSVTTAAAWTVPAVAVAVGTPAAAASVLGEVVIVAPTTFVQPGTAYPNLSVELHFQGAGIVPTNTASVTVTLPPGFTWADSSVDPRTFTATNGIVPLVGPNAVLAPTDYTHTSGTITATAVDPNGLASNPKTYTPDNQLLETKFNGGGGGTGGGAALTWSVGPYDAFASQRGTSNAFLALSPDLIPAGYAPVALSAHTNYFTVAANPTTGTTDLFASYQGTAQGINVAPKTGFRTAEQWFATSPQPQEYTPTLTSYGRLYSTRVNNPGSATDLSATFGWDNTTFITALAASYSVGASPQGNQPTWYALDRLGQVWAWGSGYHGQLGNGTNDGLATTPVRVLTSAGTPLTGVVQIEGFSGGAVARRGDGSVVAWGHNESGQLGRGTISGSGTYAEPVQDASGGNLTGVSWLGHNAVDGTSATSYVEGGVSAIKGGVLYTWGSGLGGRHVSNVDTNRTKAAPNVQVNSALASEPAGTTVRDAFSSRNSTVVILSNGHVYAWGKNNDGQLADNSFSDRATPVQSHFNTGVNGNVDGGPILNGGYFSRASDRSPAISLV